MRKNRKSLGFTMAEMLIVVAIIVVLGGVSFIAVQRHQRSMAQLERNAIAKELFIAAQNHLTMAESQGYLLENTDFGTMAQEQDKNGKPVVVHYVVGPSSGNILDQILPFGSIDETVRVGGSYLIRYQTDPAQVLDVFYVTTSGEPSRFNKEGGIKDDDYSELMALKNNLPSSGYVLGWYGHVEALESGETINAPTVEVENGERLIVKVTDSNHHNVDATKDNANAALKLIIRGETSGAKLAITLMSSNTQTPTSIGANNRFFYSARDNVYQVILDDITNVSADSPHDNQNTTDGLHFADLNSFVNSSAGVLQFMQNEKKETPEFRPGENITVQAVAYSNTSLTNIAYSSARTTNSLFADPGDTATTAMIGNFRHLENLDRAISGFEASALGFTAAEQIADMTWKDEDKDTLDFIQVIKTDKQIDPVKIYSLKDLTGTADNCYRPVSLDYALAYEGNSHAIEGVEVNYAGDAGLFGSINVAGSSVSNLALIDFNIKTSQDNAGALAGTIENCTVSNVLAHHSDGKEQTAKITTDSGNAGGLIGSATGCTIEKSAAALVVSSTGGNAGGLIGMASDGIVEGCYSGGHATNKTANDGIIGVWYGDSEKTDTKYNVTASENAGGLIGDAGTTTISNSYSTCSVAGKYAGGFVGTSASGGSAENCYATGLVLGGDITTQTVTEADGTQSTQTTVTENRDQEGAFAYSFSGTTLNCWYYEIINERREMDASENITDGYTYIYPVSGQETVAGIKALDQSVETYNDFVGPYKTAPTDSAWAGAKTWTELAEEYPYNSTLKDYYQSSYPFRTVEQLGESIQQEVRDVDGNVTTPADFVATHYGDWPAPEIFVINEK